MTARRGAPVPVSAGEAVAAEDSPLEFGPALQNLVAEFWETAEEEGQVQTEEETVDALQSLFAAMAYELGRIDGVARLHGVSREGTLQLLAKAFSAGKAAALAQHHQASQGCTCEASAVLMKELEFN